VTTPPAQIKEMIPTLALLLRRNFSGFEERARSRGFEWEQFGDFLGRNQIAGTSYLLLAGSPVARDLDQGFLRSLKQGYVHQWAQTQRLLQSLQTLSDLLGDVGQEFLLLKGPYTADRFHGDVSARAFTDLDILVPTHGFAACEAKLQEAGFSRVSRVLLSKSLSKFFTHHFEFQKQGVSVELHWRLFNHPSVRMDEDRIFASSGRWQHGGREYRVLSDEYAVATQSIAIAKDIELGFANLKPMVDLFLMLRVLDGKIDWPSFWETCQCENVSRVVATVLRMCLTLFEAHHDCPRVSKTLETRAPDECDMGATAIMRLFHPARFRIHKRLWAMRLYELSTLRCLAWWARSLPFRLAVY